jgi:cytochrome c peroxidase
MNLKNISFFVAACFAVLVFIYACPPEKAGQSKVISIIVPQGWPAPVYKFDKNKPTIAGFELGRKLFYDPRLSNDNTVSCGSCHQPFAAFSHIDHALSHGVRNKMGVRNAPPIFNMNWSTSFFWDGGVNHIEIQPLNPLINPMEMGQSLDTLVGKLAHIPEYKAMFKKAYGSEEVTSQGIFKALAQFMGMLVSYNSKYDKYMRKEPGGEFTEQELNGLTVFREKCESCHKEPLFTDYSFRNNGLTPKYGSKDSGRAHISRSADDLRKFKVPSLRNLKYTYPYMHDGRFTELSEVIEHYTGQKFPADNIDKSIKFIYLAPSQKESLLAFLNTLNDEEFVKDTRFRDADSKQDVSNEHHVGKIIRP